MAKKRSGRGSKMGAGAKKSRQQRKTGKRWLNLPPKWSFFEEEPDETYKLDILPYVVKKMKLHPEFEAMQEDVWFRYPYRLHRNVGPKRQAVLCPETIGKQCPICDKMRAMYDDPDINNKKAAKFAPGRRSLFIVKIKRGGDKKIKGKTFVWDIADGNFYKEVDKEIDRGKDDWNNFACLQGGYTIEARFAKEKFDKVEFAKCDRVDFKSRKDYPEKILDKNPCLDDMVIPNIPTAKEIKELMKPGKDDKKSGNDKGGKSNTANLDWSDIEDMDESELIEVMEDLGEDPDDLEYDDEDELRDLVAEELDIEKDVGDGKSSSSDDDDLPDADDLEEMDYDELVELVEEHELLSDNIDMDDFDDEDDDEDDLRDAIEELINDLASGSDDDEDEPTLLDQVKGAEKIKELKELVKDNDEFKKLRSKLKNFKGKKDLDKLRKKMIKALKSDKKSDKKSGSGKAGKCPFKFEYGKEWGEHDECNKKKCNAYNKCFKVYDKMQDDE